MNKKTAKALEGSIKKWVNIRDNGGEEGDCPLCKLVGYENCKSCPVSVKVMEDDCRSTPYVEWNKHQIEEHYGENTCKVRCPKCKELADKEVKFLESLREG